MPATPFATSVVKKLVQAGHIAYFAGGWVRDYLLNLETAVRDGKVSQDFDSESLVAGGSHSQMVKGPPAASDSESKGCVNLPSPTAVSRVTSTSSGIGGSSSKKQLQQREASE